MDLMDLMDHRVYCVHDVHDVHRVHRVHPAGCRVVRVDTYHSRSGGVKAPRPRQPRSTPDLPGERMLLGSSALLMLRFKRRISGP